MPSSADPEPLTFQLRLTRLVLPVTIVGAVIVLIVPLNPFFLDILIAANLTLSVLVLLTTLSIRSPREFSSFPTVLLATTLFRLVLNVASSRLILSRGGTQGAAAAGDVIRAFGSFVAGDSVAVGVILFLILVVIQFVVITRGAARIGEVAARFMLDGLPGRQMAIDADLHSGLIDQPEAQRRREALYRQADFFGAMDGAGKFVRGDAVAGLVIVFVNICAGLYLGVVNGGMSPGEAVDVFTKLTIGDGLVSQVPAFLTSLAAGLIVTRSSADTDLGKDVSLQLFGNPTVLAAAAGFLAVLSVTRLPKVPLLAISGALAAGAVVLRLQANARRVGSPPETGARRSRNEESASAATIETAADAAVAALPADLISDKMEELLQVDPLELEIGYRLIGLADPTRGGDLLERMRSVRHGIARELGLIVPQVRVRDEIGLGPHDYRIKIRGATVGQGIAYAGRLLAAPPSESTTKPDGRDGRDPVTGRPAVWIHAEGREVAELAGCKVLDAPAVIASHFGEIVLQHADELMTREQLSRMLERVRSSAPALVDEVIPGLLRAGEVQRVLQNLLRERVSVRDLETILETLAEYAGKTRDTDQLTEYAREGLGRSIAQQYLGADGRLRVVTLDPGFDTRLAASAKQTDARPAEALGAETARNTAQAVAMAVGAVVEAGFPPVVLCSAHSRPILKDLTRADLPRLAILSRREIPRDIPIDVLGVIVEEDAQVAEVVSASIVAVAPILT